MKPDRSFNSIQKMLNLNHIQSIDITLQARTEILPWIIALFRLLSNRPAGASPYPDPEALRHIQRRTEIVSGGYAVNVCA